MVESDVTMSSKKPRTYQNPLFRPIPPSMATMPTKNSIIAAQDNSLSSPPEKFKMKCSACQIIGVALVVMLAIAVLVAICIVLVFKLPQAQGNISITDSNDIESLRQDVETLKQLVYNLRELFNSTLDDLQASEGGDLDLQNRIDSRINQVSRAFQLDLDKLRTNLNDSLLSVTTVIDQTSQNVLRIELQMTNYTAQLSTRLSRGIDIISHELAEIQTNLSTGEAIIER